MDSASNIPEKSKSPETRGTLMPSPNSIASKKRKLTLDLPPSPVVASVSGCSGGGVGVGASPGFLLTSPDVRMLKITSPELERYILQGMLGQQQKTPSPCSVMYPKNVTEDQEQYAKGFLDCLNSMHRDPAAFNMMGSTNVAFSPGGVLNGNNMGQNVVYPHPQFFLQQPSDQPMSMQIQIPPQMAMQFLPQMMIAQQSQGQQGQQLQLSQLQIPSSQSNNNSNQLQLPCPPPPLPLLIPVSLPNSTSVHHNNNNNSNHHRPDPPQTQQQHQHQQYNSPSVSPASFSDGGQTVPSRASSSSVTGSTAGQKNDEDGSFVEADQHQNQHKTDRKRERNRLAAAKCRQRKMDRIAVLEENIKNIKEQNEQLTDSANLLRNSLQEMKTELLRHVQAGCELPLSSKLRSELKKC